MNNQVWLSSFIIALLIIVGWFLFMERKTKPTSSDPAISNAWVSPVIDAKSIPVPVYENKFNQFPSENVPIANYWPRPDMTTFLVYDLPFNIFTPGGGGSPGPSPSPSPTEPPPPPPPPPTAVQQNLTKYFKQVWPNLTTVTPEQLKQIYENLDAYYTDWIPTLEKKAVAQYEVDRMNSLTSIDNNANLEYARLFDGNVCDCLRMSHAECIYSPNRLTPNELKDCKTWPYMHVLISNQWLMRRAYDTDNTDSNYRPDQIKRSNMSGKKGFPNGAYYEGFVYPGEYGIPDMCTNKPDPFFLENQPGLTVNGKKFNIQRSSPPWWYPTDCSSTPCEFDDEKCLTVVSDGSYGGPQSNGTFKRCYRDGTYSFGEDPIKPASAPKTLHKASGIREYLTTDLDPDCPGGFPPNVCAEVKAKDYRGYWTYPLIGCGTWWTVGQSVVTNTKLGLLLSSPAEQGAGLDLDELMKLRGQTNAFEQNLFQQVKRVSEIIRNGSVPANGSMWSAMTLDTLKQHGYKGDRITDSRLALEAAKDLVTYWYKEGYSGLESTPNGFNYNYQKYFPLGCHFAYASRFDHLLVAFMTVRKLDSIQLLMEPQNSKVGLRPAYMFEVFSKKPRTAEAAIGSAFQDTSITSCRACFSCDPGPQIQNFMKYGYLPKTAVTNPQRIDPAIFLARASKKSFIPIV